jgi:F-type H+-transporting ATPase subunit b
MSFSWWTFALQAANFLILIWLLQRFLFKPVKAMVARRKEEISRALTEASAEKQNAERLKEEIRGQRAGIDAERQKMLDDMRAQFTAEHEKIVEQARREAEKVTTETIERLDQQRAAAADKLFERAVLLATNLAERLLREVAPSSLERAFLGRVSEYLDRLPMEKRAELLPRNGASTLTITSAHALDAQQQSQWREQLLKVLPGELSIKFDADPALIAGVVISFPHAILRFNWRDSLALMIKEIHGDEHFR